MIGVYDDLKRHPRQCIDMAYVVEVEGEIIAGDNALEYKWELMDNILDLAFDHKQIVDDYLKK